MKTFYVYLVLLISLSGCVSTIVVHPNYKNTDYKGSSLLLRMTDDTLGLDYAGDLTNEFGSEGVNDSIKSFLTSELLKHLRDGSNYKEIAFCTGHDKLDMTKLAYRYRKDGVRIDSLEFFTPNTTLTDSTDVTMTLQNIFIKSYVKINFTTIGFLPVPSKPSKSRGD